MSARRNRIIRVFFTIFPFPCVLFCVKIKQKYMESGNVFNQKNS